MKIDYQVVVNFIVSLMYLLAPITSIFVIVEIITNFFFDLVRGNRRVKL